MHFAQSFVSVSVGLRAELSAHFTARLAIARVPGGAAVGEGAALPTDWMLPRLVHRVLVELEQLVRERRWHRRRLASLELPLALGGEREVDGARLVAVGQQTLLRNHETARLERRDVDRRQRRRAERDLLRHGCEIGGLRAGAKKAGFG